MAEPKGQKVVGEVVYYRSPETLDLVEIEGKSLPLLVLRPRNSDCSITLDVDGAKSLSELLSDWAGSK